MVATKTIKKLYTTDDLYDAITMQIDVTKTKAIIDKYPQILQ